jgi:cytoskeleton protein RodZ
MEKENFGSVLREAREKRRLSINEVARKTKVTHSSLSVLESGDIDRLPPDVFVRGFIRSYAKMVGISDVEPLGLYQKAVDERRRTEEALVAQPRPPVERSESPEDEGQPQRKGIGLAVFVIIVLLLATITWSLFLRQTPQAGEGLSLLDDAAQSAPSSRLRAG